MSADEAEEPVFPKTLKEAIKGDRVILQEKDEQGFLFKIVSVHSSDQDYILINGHSSPTSFIRFWRDTGLKTGPNDGKYSLVNPTEEVIQMIETQNQRVREREAEEAAPPAKKEAATALTLTPADIRQARRLLGMAFNSTAVLNMMTDNMVVKLIELNLAAYNVLMSETNGQFGQPNKDKP